MKIAVIGTQNTGKTSFIKAFVKEFPNYITPEKTYRDFIKENNLTINSEVTLENQKLMYEFTKQQLEDYKDKTNVIFDRSIIDVFIYSLKLAEDSESVLIVENERLAFIYHLFEEIKNQLKNNIIDLVLLFPLSASIPLTNDGVREIDWEYIDYINEQFIETCFGLSSYPECQGRFIVMSGTTKQKIEKIKNYITN